MHARNEIIDRILLKFVGSKITTKTKEKKKNIGKYILVGLLTLDMSYKKECVFKTIIFFLICLSSKNTCCRPRKLFCHNRKACTHRFNQFPKKQIDFILNKNVWLFVIHPWTFWSALHLVEMEVRTVTGHWNGNVYFMERQEYLLYIPPRNTSYSTHNEAIYMIR